MIYAVVAGNRREFDSYFSEQRLVFGGKWLMKPGQAHVIDPLDNEHLYINNWRQLLGLKDYCPVFYGTYLERNDLPQIEEHINMAIAAGDIKVPQS